MTEADPTDELRSEFDTVFARARGGDRTAVPRLRELLDEDPGAWAGCADLADLAREAWVQAVARDDLAAAEVLRRQAVALRDELAGPDPPLLIRLLADRVAASWLQVHHADCLAAGHAAATTPPARFALDRLEATERRHLRALAALTTARTVLAPVTRTPEPAKPLEIAAFPTPVPPRKTVARHRTRHR